MAFLRSLHSLLRCSPLLHFRAISSTPVLESLGWIDKIKGVFTGKPSAPSFSLNDFADQMEQAMSRGMLKKFEVGRCSEATMANAFQKQSSILRYLGTIDPTGESCFPRGFVSKDWLDDTRVAKEECHMLDLDHLELYLHANSRESSSFQMEENVADPDTEYSTQP